MKLHGYSLEKFYFENYTQLLIQLDSSPHAQNEMNKLAFMISFRYLQSVKYM